MDLPGFRSREPSGTDSISLSGNMPLLSTYGQNRFEEFCIDFSDELVHSHVLRNIFDDSVGYNSYITVDGVTLPPVSFFTMVNAGCIELLHGLQLGDRSQRKSGGVLGVMDKASSYFKQGKGGDKRDADVLKDLMTKLAFTPHSLRVLAPQGAQIRHFSASIITRRYATTIRTDP